MEAVLARLEESNTKEEMDETEIRMEEERREGEMGPGLDIKLKWKTLKPHLPDSFKLTRYMNIACWI